MILINKIIRHLGRDNYSIDSNISTLDMMISLLEKLAQVLRGSWIRIWFHHTQGLLFVGKNCNITYRHKISTGKTVTIGNNVQIKALSKEGIKIGNNVSILSNTIIECTGVIRNIGEELVVGNNVGIAQNCFIQVRGKVLIGNNVIFGPGVSIFSENHNYSDPTEFINKQGETRIGVTINDGVWIASGATILDGVTIGSNSIIAAGSLVNKDVPPFSIVGGVPAKLLKVREKSK